MTLPLEVLKKYLELIGVTDKEFAEYQALLKKQASSFLSKEEQSRLDKLAEKLKQE